MCSCVLGAETLAEKVVTDLSQLMSVFCPFQMFLTLAQTHLDAAKPYRPALRKAGVTQTGERTACGFTVTYGGC